MMMMMIVSILQTNAKHFITQHHQMALWFAKKFMNQQQKITSHKAILIWFINQIINGNIKSMNSNKTKSTKDMTRNTIIHHSSTQWCWVFELSTNWSEKEALVSFWRNNVVHSLVYQFIKNDFMTINMRQQWDGEEHFWMLPKNSIMTHYETSN